MDWKAEDEDEGDGDDEEGNASTFQGGDDEDKEN